MKSAFYVTVIALVAAVLSPCSTAFAQAVPAKIGFVNSAEVMAQAPGRAEAEAQFDKEMGGYRAQVQRMEDSLRTLVSNFEKEAAKLDSATRVTRGRAIQTREEEYQKRAQSMQEQMQQRQQALVNPILERINTILEAIRAEEGYAMIFDIASQGSPIVAADKSLDITDKVVARLKAAGPITSGPSSAVPTPTGVTRPRQ